MFLNHRKKITSCFDGLNQSQSFQNVLQPWRTVYNDFYPVATEVTSNLLSLPWRLRLHPIVGSNDPKPDPIYATLRIAFHPKCALSARKCIAQYRLKFQITHCQFFFLDPPLYIYLMYQIYYYSGFLVKHVMLILTF